MTGQPAPCPTGQRVACVGTTTTCSGVPCNGSQTNIGDVIPSSAGGQTTVIDENSMWVGSTEVGWMMKGSDGNRYVQYNYTQQSTWNWAVSVGIASLGGGTPQYSGVMHWNGKLPPGTGLFECVTGDNGQTLA